MLATTALVRGQSMPTAMEAARRGEAAADRFILVAESAADLAFGARRRRLEAVGARTEPLDVAERVVVRIEATHGADAFRSDWMSAFPEDFTAPLIVDERGGWLSPTSDLIVAVDRAVDPQVERELTARLPPGSVDRDLFGLQGVLRIRGFAKDGASVLEAARALVARPGVRFAEPDWLLSAVKAHFPNDPSFGVSWSLHNPGTFPSPFRDRDMDVAEAWDLTGGSQEVTVVVIDDGIQMDHPDLPLTLGVDTTSQGPGIGANLNNWDWHGTLVAGTIGAIIDNGRGSAGVCPEGRMVSVRAYVSNSFAGSIVQGSWIAAAVAYAQQIGARITNNSVTLTVAPALSTAAYDAARLAGVLHFACSGNSTSLPTLSYPGVLMSVNAVTGLELDYSLIWFATTGPGVDFAAPATYIRTTDLTGPDGFDAGDYTYPQGTTFSAANGSAVAALTLAANPSLGAGDVESILQATSQDLGVAGYDLIFGWGALNAYSAVWRAAMLRSDPTTMIFGRRSSAANDGFGEVVAGIGDLTGDLVPDFAVGIPGDDSSGIDAGRIEVVSGATGSVALSLQGAVPGDMFGKALAGLDLDGDGRQDLIVGASGAAGGAGRVSAYSATGVLLWSIVGGAGDGLGSALLALGDVDGNGSPDVAIGVPGASVLGVSGVGRVEVRNAQGALIGASSGNGARGERSFGAVLASALDRDGDGLDDVFVGAPDSQAAGTTSGTACILRSVGLLRLSTVDGPGPGARLGAAICQSNDFDGDGLGEAALGAPGASLGTPGGGGVYIWWSAANTLLPGVPSPATGDGVGTALAAADVDADGFLDLVVGVPGHDLGGVDSGRVIVVSGTSFQILYDLLGGASGSRFGSALAPVGDIDADGFDEVVVGALGDGPLALPGLAAIFPAPSPARRRVVDVAAKGSVGSTSGGPFEVLLVNGSGGGVDRTVEIPIGLPFTFSLEQPASSAAPVFFAIYGTFGVPAPAATVVLPAGIGVMAVPPGPLSPGAPGLFTLTSNAVADPSAALLSTPSPWRFTVPFGAPQAVTCTLQGVIFDSATGWQVTNAVILEIR